jgi:uncharacterized alkaline shock family protein YloU
MFYSKRTSLGRVRYDKLIIGNIAKHVLRDYGRSVIPAGPKGRLARGPSKPDSDDLSFIEARVKNGKIDLTLYIVIRFGASIKTTIETIGQSLRKEINAMTGMPVDKLSIIVVGVLSKNIAKRHIEVTTYGGQS